MHWLMQVVTTCYRLLLDDSLVPSRAWYEVPTFRFEGQSKKLHTELWMDQHKVFPFFFGVFFPLFLMLLLLTLLPNCWLFTSLLLHLLVSLFRCPDEDESGPLRSFCLEFWSKNDVR